MLHVCFTEFGCYVGLSPHASGGGAFCISYGMQCKVWSHSVWPLVRSSVKVASRGSGAPEEEPVIEEIEQALRKSRDIAHAFTLRRRVQVEQPRRAPDTCVDEKATHLRRSLRGASFVEQKSVCQPMDIPTVQ